MSENKVLSYEDLLESTKIDAPNNLSINDTKNKIIEERKPLFNLIEQANNKILEESVSKWKIL